MTSVNGDNVNIPGTATIATAVVTAALNASAAGIVFPFKQVGANYPATLADLFIELTAATFTVTLPDAATCAGQMFFVILTAGSGTATVATVAGNIGPNPTYTLNTGGNKFVWVLSNGTNYLIIGSD